MSKSAAIYKMTRQSVGDYLDDLEVRWGVGVALEVRMTSYGPGASLMTLRVIVPAPIHRRELDTIPDITRILTLEASQDLWGVAWGALYDFDLALGGELKA